MSWTELRMFAEVKWVRVAFEVIGYLAMLGLLMIATYALWLGPEWFGVNESWPLVFYFVVAYFGTVLVSYGVIVAVRVCAML